MTYIWWLDNITKKNALGKAFGWKLVIITFPHAFLKNNNNIIFLKNKLLFYTWIKFVFFNILYYNMLFVEQRGSVG